MEDSWCMATWWHACRILVHSVLLIQYVNTQWQCMLMWSPCLSCPSGGQQHQPLAAHTGKGDCAAGRAVIGQAEEGVCAVQGLHTDMVGPPHVTMAVNISIYCSIGLYTHCMYIHVCKVVVNCRNIKAHTYVHTWSMQGILCVYIVIHMIRKL